MSGSTRSAAGTLTTTVGATSATTTSSNSTARAAADGRTPRSARMCMGTTPIRSASATTEDDSRPKDTRTPEQKAPLYALADDVPERHPGATVHGHDEYASKARPSFDANACREARLREREVEANTARRRSFARHGPPNEVGGYGDMACHAVPPGAAWRVDSPPPSTTTLPPRPRLAPEPGPACWLPAEEDRRGPRPPPRSELDRDHHLRLAHLAAELGPQRRGVLLQQREGPVVAGDHRLEVEERLRGKGGALHVHGEMPAGAEDPDLGRVEGLEHLHVGHDVGVAREVDRLPFPRDHEARLGAGIVQPGEGRGVRRLHHRHLHLAEGDRAALVEADRLDAVLALYPLHEVVDADDLGAGLLRDLRRVARMIAVAVADEHPARAFDRLVEAALVEHRIAAQPGIHQQRLARDLHAEAGMPEPGQSHLASSRPAPPKGASGRVMPAPRREGKAGVPPDPRALRLG